MTLLTKRQKEILEFIQYFTVQSGFCPSYREIGDHFKLSSLGTVYKHIKTLESKGFIKKQKTEARSLEITHNPSYNILAEVNIDFIGILKAGYPIETFAQSKSLPLPTNLVKNPENTYIFQVAGTGFTEDHLLDGDLVIIDTIMPLSNGKTIVALINKQDTIIKRFYDDSDFIRLEPINPSYKPIFIRKDNIDIQGVVIGIYRQLI